MIVFSNDSEVLVCTTTKLSFGAKRRKLERLVGAPQQKEKTMDIPTKVTLEITAKAYTTTVYAGNKKLSERTCRMESAGSARGTKPGDVFDDITDESLQDFAESVDELCGFDVAGHLYDLQ